MPPKSPKGNAAVAVVPTEEEEQPQEIPWPPIEYIEKRRADTQKWLLESVQAKQDDKARRELERLAQEATAKKDLEVYNNLMAREQRAADAFMQRERGIEETARRAVEAARRERASQLGAVCWPLRPKPVYLSYAQHAGYRERTFVSGLVTSLYEKGLERVWVDKNEGVLGSPHCLVDRADALSHADVVVVVVSEAYMKCPQATLELMLMRARCVGGIGKHLRVILVMYKLEHFSDFPLKMVDHIQTIMFSKGKDVVDVVRHETTGQEYEDAARVSGQVFQLASSPLKSRRISMRMDMRQEDDVPHDPDAQHKRFVEMWMYAKEGQRTKRVAEWNVHEVLYWIESQGRAIARLAPIFRSQCVDGFRLVTLDHESLERDLGVEVLATRTRFLEALERRVEQDARSAWGPRISELSPAELRDFITDVFVSADKDGNGVLDRKEFKECLQSTYLSLSRAEIHKVMVNADEDENGIISYQEFVPVMVQLVQMAKAHTEARQEQKQRSSQQTDPGIVKGMPKNELDALLLRMFQESDLDRNGKLDRKEFKTCLHRPELGLSRKEINSMLSDMVTDNEGYVLYEVFLPTCFSMLQNRQEEDMQLLGVGDSNRIRDLLLQHLEKLDPQQQGKLLQAELRSALSQVSREHLGLSEMQIVLILAEAHTDKRGRCEYRKFVDVAAPIIQKLYDMDSQAGRQRALANIACTNTVRGLDEERVVGMLGQALRQADKSNRGALKREELENVLVCMRSSKLALTSYETSALMAAMEMDDNGEIHYGKHLKNMFELLVHLDREQKVMQFQASNV